jgi:hypothetical protein
MTLCGVTQVARYGLDICKAEAWHLPDMPGGLRSIFRRLTRAKVRHDIPLG